MKGFRVSTCLSTLGALVSIGLVACGGGSSSSNGVTDPGTPPPPPPPPNGSTTMLSVTNDKFTPAHDSVGVGATLVWTWNTCSGDGYGGTSCVSHSVTFDDGPTSPIQPSGTFSRTFASPGTYTYHCKVHGAAMSGSVLVQ